VGLGEYLTRKTRAWSETDEGATGRAELEQEQRRAGLHADEDEQLGKIEDDDRSAA
jgi:hypothetical protein